MLLPGKMEKYLSELSEFYLEDMTETNSRLERELITIKPTIKHLKLASPYGHLTLKSFFSFFFAISVLQIKEKKQKTRRLLIR